MTADLSQYGLAPVGSPHGSIDSGSGTFTPTTPPGPRLNPFTNPGPWGKVDLGGLTLPGVILSIDGATKPESWSVQKGTSTSGASTVWKGTGLAEAIKIQIAAHNAKAFDVLCDLQTLLRPKLGTKPPSLNIVNAVINWNGITRVAVKDIGQPTWVPAGGYWTLTIELIEYSPSKKTNAGPATPAKAGSGFDQGKQPTANEVAAKELQKALQGIF